MSVIASSTTARTAVDDFARRHDDGELPANERWYRELIPLAQPADGEQFAFDVDLDACTGCKSCVVACHSLNGLDEDESWRSVGLIQGSGKVAFQQTVTTACHHCLDPACLTGCPVDAYEKDPATGIVSHLDDQCIGCGYCTLTCPYEVPKFNEARGIVRKCDMCRGRLAVGEAPACVQSCPNRAIRITIVSKAAARSTAAVDGAALVPGAPASAITTPTTVYRSSKHRPDDARAADHFSLRPAPPHPPLAAMLVLTQLAVGMLAVDLGLRIIPVGSLSRAMHGAHPALAAAVGIAAVAASVLHLGRPRYAFRAVLGISHSWLSREVVAFGAFGVLAPAYAASVWVPWPSAVRGALGALALLAGAAGVACSVMLYAVTKRAWWRARRTAPTFIVSGLLTGSMLTMTTTAVVALVDASVVGAAVEQERVLGGVVVALMVTKLGLEVLPLLWVRRATITDLRRSALLLRRELWTQVQLRVLLGVVGGMVVPLAVAAGAAPNPTSGATLGMAVACLGGTAFVLAGELIERHHFFRVAVAPRMPGELR